MTNNTRTIESIPQAAARFDRTSAWYYKHCAEKHGATLPPPMPFGPNSSGVYVDETDRALAAYAAGLSDDERRQLVALILAEREEESQAIREMVAANRELEAA